MDVAIRFPKDVDHTRPDWMRIDILDLTAKQSDALLYVLEKSAPYFPDLVDLLTAFQTEVTATQALMGMTGQ